MEFHFRCDVNAFDLWKMAMSRIYRSPVGVVNIVFSVAAVLLTARIWGSSGEFMRGLLVFACLLFPLIQPVAIYGKSVKQLEDQPGDMELFANDSGVHITTGGKEEFLIWSRIHNAVKYRDMIVILTDASHGYMLSGRTLGEQKEAFFAFLCSKLIRS